MATLKWIFSKDDKPKESLQGCCEEAVGAGVQELLVRQLWATKDNSLIIQGEIFWERRVVKERRKEMQQKSVG